MKSRNIFLAAFILITVAAIAGCSAAARSAGQPINGSTAGGAPTRTPAATSISNVTTAIATATPSTGYTPIPTRDVISELVTQAYSRVTSTLPAPQPPAPTTAATSIVPANIALLLTPTATLNPAPASVIVGEPILIPGAVGTADCKIRNSGDCTPSMSAGVTLFLTWRFGVQGAETFD